MRVNPIQKYKILTYTFSTLFFVVTITWAVLSVNGWIINTDRITENTDGQLILETGWIRVNNTQFEDKSDISAFLDNSQIQLNENRIENVKPGKYQLRLSVPDYAPWENEIEISPSKVTDIYPFFFYSQDKIKPEIMTKRTNVDKVFFSPTSDYAYFVVTKNPDSTKNGIYKYQLTQTNTGIFASPKPVETLVAQIPETLKPVVESGNYEIIPSQDNQKFIFASPDSPTYIFDTSRSSFSDLAAPIVLEEVLGFKPGKFFWFKGSSSIVFEHEFLLAELILSNKKIQIVEYSPSKNPIYSVDGNNIVYYSHNHKSLNEYKDETSTQLMPWKDIDDKTKITHIYIDKNSGTNILVADAQSLYIIDNSQKTKQPILDISQNRIMEVSNNGMGILYERESKIYSMLLDEISNTDTNKSKEPKEYLIAENYNSENTKIFWNSSSSHILIYDKNQKKINISDKNGRNLTDIFQNDKIASDTIKMISNNSQLVILLEDSSSEESPSANIYSLNLDSARL